MRAPTPGPNTVHVPDLTLSELPDAVVELLRDLAPAASGRCM